MSFNGFSDDKSDITVQGDGWWPALAVGDFQAVYRLPGEYEAQLLVDHLKLAMSWAQDQLAAWRAAREAEGCESLAAAPGPEIDGEPRSVLLYRRAVFAHAKALLLLQWKTIGRRDVTGREAQDTGESEDTFYEFAQQAVADLQGRARVTVELI